ncbi:MAG: nucleotide exchange factor GrpE [Gammaproteobacteria bacterium]
MRGRHKKAGEENSIESLINEEAMPDDAVLPPAEAAVTDEPAADTAGGTEVAVVPTLDDQLTLLNQALEEHKRLASGHRDEALRARAELENVRKRTARDIENAHKYALERFVAELLPVLDSMEKGIAVSANTNDAGSLKEGMELTLRMLVALLDKFGVKVIDPRDEKFNPDRHEAVSMQRHEGVEPGMVINVMQKGYELNGRLVRPAMVVVSQ